MRATTHCIAAFVCCLLPLLNTALTTKKNGPTRIHHNVAKVDQSTNQTALWYLQRELELPADTIDRIYAQAPSVMGMTAETLRHKTNALEQFLPNAKSLYTKYPPIFQLSVQDNILPTLRFLKEELQLSTLQLTALLQNCPSIVTYQKSTLQAKIAVFTHTLELTKAQTAQICIQQEPRILRSSVKNGLLPRIQFFKRELEFNTTQLQQLVIKFPSVLLMSIADTFIPKLIFYLQMTLHMEMDDIQRLLLRYPQWLSYSLDRHILPLTQYLFLQVELTAPQVAQMMTKYPKLVTYSLAHIQMNVQILQNTTNSLVTTQRVLIRAPQVLGFAPDTLRNKIDYLQQILSNEDWTTILHGMPTILHLSNATLASKLDYLHTKLSKNQLETLLRQLPATLAYSLSKRLYPRCEALAEADLLNRVAQALPLSDAAFAKWLPKQIKKGAIQQESCESTAPPEKHSRQQGTITNNDQGRIVHWTRERRRE